MSETYRSSRTWSLITVAGLAFVSFFKAIMILIGFAQVLNPGAAVDLGKEGMMSSWILIYGIVSFFHLPVIVMTIIAFLVWLNRSYKNLLALRPTYLRFSSGWAVGWWFIPFANLVKPFQVVREVWSESDPEIPTDQMFLTESLHAAPTYMGWWWAFWIISNIASNLTSKVFDYETLDHVFAIGIALIVTSLLTIIAAFLAIMVVRDITARQAARHLSVLSLEAAERASDNPFEHRNENVPRTTEDQR